jgi:hypothetical protein
MIHIFYMDLQWEIFLAPREQFLGVEIARRVHAPALLGGDQQAWPRAIPSFYAVAGGTH